MKEQLSQLVQDVIDGNESAIKASKILLDLSKHMKKCVWEIAGYLDKEQNGYNKNLN